MPTEKPRVTITMTEEQLRQIEDYRFNNKIKNQTQAILSLVEKGIDELERRDAEKQKIPPSFVPPKPEEESQSELRIFATALERAGILEPGDDLKESDVDFLFAMFMALKAHFNQSEKDRN